MTHLRAASPDDAEAIEAVRSMGWRRAYSGLIPADFLATYRGSSASRRRRMESGRALTEIVAVDETDTVLGWLAVIAPTAESGLDPRHVGEVAGCYVDPAHWRMGIGTQLLREGMTAMGRAGLTEVALWVLRDNAPARRFYESFGLQADGAERIQELGGPVVALRYRGSVT